MSLLVAVDASVSRFFGFGFFVFDLGPWVSGFRFRISSCGCGVSCFVKVPRWRGVKYRGGVGLLVAVDAPCDHVRVPDRTHLSFRIYL